MRARRSSSYSDKGASGMPARLRDAGFLAAGFLAAGFAARWARCDRREHLGSFGEIPGELLGAARRSRRHRARVHVSITV